MNKFNWYYYRTLLYGLKAFSVLFGAGAFIISVTIILGLLGIGPKYELIAVPLILVFWVIPFVAWKLSSFGLKKINSNKPQKENKN